MRPDRLEVAIPSRAPDAVETGKRQKAVRVTIVGATSAQSDTNVARWFERFLAAETPGTAWIAQTPASKRAAA